MTIELSLNDESVNYGGVEVIANNMSTGSKLKDSLRTSSSANATVNAVNGDNPRKGDETMMCKGSYRP